MAVQIPFPLPATGFALNSKVRVNLDFLVAQFNEFNSGTATWDNVSVGTVNSLTGTITLYNAFNANYVTVKAGATSSSHTYTMPLALPASTGVLQSASDGTLSWATTVTGQLIFSSGSVATPSLRAADNLDTGINYATSGTVFSMVYDGTRFFGREAGGVFLENIPNSPAGGLVYNASGYLQCLANGVGATGMVVVATSQTPKVVQILGTTNQVTVAINTNDVTFSLPQSIDTGANFQVASIRTGAGSASGVAVRLNAANTGIYMNASNIMAFTIQGTDYAALDNSGAWFVTGELRGATVRTTGTLKISTGVGIVTIQSTGSTSYTLTLPPDDGTSGDVLRTDGTGVLTWVSVSAAGGATAALDNLASVAINTTLVSDTNNTDDLGTSSIKWRTGYFGTSVVITTAGTAGITVNSSSAQTTLGGVDIGSGGIGIVVGADSGAITRTNSATKLGRIGCPHYLTAEEPVAMVVGSMDGTDHIVSVGGGTGLLNAATVVRIMTAANTTTTSGTERARFDTNGNFAFGGSIATNATDGFFYISTCAGAPTGAPTAFSGRVPMVFDTTNNKFWIYDGGWLGVVLA